MFGLSAAQLALLQAPAQEVKAAVEVAIASPLRYCTGADAIEIDSDWYTPRSLAFDEIKLDTPSSASCAVVIDDLEGDIRTAWYAERFSGTDVTFHILLRQEGGTWAQMFSLVWYCTTCAYNKHGEFRINVAGGAGLRPRAGLRMGNRTDFPFAPEPGEAMKFGSGGIVFSHSHTVIPPIGYQHFSIWPSMSATDGESGRLSLPPMPVRPRTP